MTNTRTALCCLITLLLFTAGAGLRAQKVSTAKGFVIDPNRPYVYLKFDHIGPGLPRDDSEPTARIWLRVTNNCRVPIIVSTYGLPEGSPKDEQGVMDDVVADLQGMTMTDGSGPLTAVPPTKAKAVDMPNGYSSEVGSFESIPPGREVLFSVPINHLGTRWHLEIPFRFDLPPGKGLRDATVGGEPNMVIRYTIYDLPPKYQAQIGP